MPLSTFDIVIPKEKVMAAHASETTNLLYETRTVAGIAMDFNAQFCHNNQLYVYYWVTLTDYVTEVTVKAQASIINVNGNKCRAVDFTYLYQNRVKAGFGNPLSTFSTFGSIEQYLVNDMLTIRIEINDLIRTPDEWALLERICRATDANEQLLFEARLAEQTKCNEQQQETIKLLQATVESVRSQLEDTRKRKVGGMDASASSSSSSSSSSGLAGVLADPPPSTSVDVTKLDDRQMNDLQEAIIKEKKKRNTCVICLDNPVTITFIPCGHRKTCKECCEKLAESGTTCPICRQVIERKIETF
jgi:hypothetical protein